MVQNLTAQQRHSLTHYPADPNCKVCAKAKMRKFPARTKDAKDRSVAKTANEMCHLDTIGPVVPLTVHTGPATPSSLSFGTP